MAGTLISCHPEHSTNGKPASRGGPASAAGWLYPALVLVAGLLAYIPWLGSYGLLDPTDSFFLESGRELLEKNQFLLPLNNYVPWLDKPILFFWMVAAAYKCFGINPFIGRLPAALSAVAAASIIYFGSRTMLKARTAALAALIFLATPLSSIVGHVCLTDMTLCALIAGSILFLFKGLEYASRRDLLLGYFFMGLAMLCKGPISVIICGLAFLPYLISISQSKKDFCCHLLALAPISGTAIVLLLNLPWYILASMATEGKFLEAFFITQNFGRMVGTVNHQEPFYFYIPVFLGAFFPWCTLGICAPGLFRKTINRKQSESSKYRRFFRLNLFWFLTVIALFSAIKTKLPTYILPCAPAFAILAAAQIEILAKAGRLQRLVPATALTTLALVATVVVGGIHKGSHWLLTGYVRDIFVQNAWLIAPLAISLIFCWIGLAQKNVRLYAAAILACALLTCAVMVPRGMRIFYEQKQLGFNRLACRARDDRASVAMIFAEEPSVPWFTHQPVSRLMNKEDALRFLSQTRKPHYVLVQTSGMPRLDWFTGPHSMLAESGKWHLIQVDAQ